MEDVSTDYKENSKKFWSFIKSKGQEWTGVAPGVHQTGLGLALMLLPLV
jgi:hypothetical protein